MKPQVPAEGIMKTGEYGDSKSYAVICSCGGTDCEHNVWIEADDCHVTVSTYTKIKTKWWKFNRFQIIWTLLTKGYVEYEGTILMSEQQALNYAETLKTAIKDVEAFRKDRQGKAERATITKIANEQDCV
jgi:hypothetical protein